MKNNWGTQLKNLKFEILNWTLRQTGKSKNIVDPKKLTTQEIIVMYLSVLTIKSAIAKTRQSAQLSFQKKKKKSQLYDYQN